MMPFGISPRRSRGLPRRIRLNPRDLQDRAPHSLAQTNAIPILHLGNRLAAVRPPIAVTRCSS
jgi:hypothetical protein